MDRVWYYKLSCDRCLSNLHQSVHIPSYGDPKLKISHCPNCQRNGNRVNIEASCSICLVCKYQTVVFKYDDHVLLNIYTCDCL